jgi:hypothetical protein
MKLLSISMLSLGLLAAPVLAQDEVTPVTVVVDADNNGVYSADELRVVWVDLSDEDIVLIDADADGSITEEELTMARDTMDVLKENVNGQADETMDAAKDAEGTGG